MGKGTTTKTTGCTITPNRVPDSFFGTDSITTITSPDSVYTDYLSSSDTINTSSIDTSTITVNSGYSPMAGDSIWLDDTPSNIKLGGQTLNEEKIEKLTALLDVLDGMEGTELAAMLETQILLNKVRNGNT